MSFQSLARQAAGMMLLAFVAAAAQAAISPQQAYADAITRAMEAVVGVEVLVADDARSAETLGEEREGTGVVIGPDGLILTIGYLILEADTIQITTHDNRVVPARVVGYDQATGFGLVRTVLPLRGVRPAAMGSARGLPLHTPLLAATGGDEAGTVLTELVGARPFSGFWEYHIESALFTSPPVRNHSGAALFNERGELLGIGSLFVGDASGEGRPLPGNMFVPVDLLKPVLAEMQATGSTRAARRPWLGVNSSEEGGRVRILRVSRDGPARAAGLAAGDVVLAVDGTKVSTLEGFYKRVWAHANPEDEIQLTVLQGADVRQVTLHGVDRMTTMRRPAGI